jgi:hypothetical protein
MPAAPAAPTTDAEPVAPSGEVAAIFDAIQGLLSVEMVQRVGGLYAFKLKGKEGGTWYLDLKHGSGAAGQGAIPAGLPEPDVIMSLSSDNFAKMFSGKLKPSTAFMMGKLKIQGDMTMAIKLEKLMKRMSAPKL